MANAIAESSLNPESSVLDSNGYVSNGLWMFNEESYPDSGALITGNCSQDIAQQVGYLKAHITGQALNGSTPAEVAGNFAQFFENCQTCQPDEASYDNRVANASIVAGWVSSGDWPVSTSGVTLTSATGTAGPSPTSTGAAGTCLLPAFSVCLLSKSQARALIGGMLMVGGFALALPGVVILAAFAFRGAGGQQAANAGVAALESTPGYGTAIRYSRERARMRTARRQGAASGRASAARSAARRSARATAGSSGAGP